MWRKLITAILDSVSASSHIFFVYKLFELIRFLANFFALFGGMASVSTTGVDLTFVQSETEEAMVSSWSASFIDSYLFPLKSVVPFCSSTCIT